MAATGKKKQRESDGERVRQRGRDSTKLSFSINIVAGKEKVYEREGEATKGEREIGRLCAFCCCLD